MSAYPSCTSCAANRPKKLRPMRIGSAIAAPSSTAAMSQSSTMNAMTRYLKCGGMYTTV